MLTGILMCTMKSIRAMTMPIVRTVVALIKYKIGSRQQSYVFDSVMEHSTKLVLCGYSMRQSDNIHASTSVKQLKLAPYSQYIFRA